LLILCAALSVQGQQTAGAQDAGAQNAAAGTPEQRVPLSEAATAFDAQGRAALSARLRTTDLRGSVDAPVKNVLLLLENRSAEFYTYVTGWATFYDGAGVRCGEGLFKLDALAPGESAEADAPGMRLTCAPATWRVVAINLLTRAKDSAAPAQPAQAGPTETQTERAAATPEAQAAPLFVNVTVEGSTYRVPLGGTLEVPVRRRRTRITVSAATQ
jgi:hypothetical protein